MRKSPFQAVDYIFFSQLRWKRARSRQKVQSR